MKNMFKVSRVCLHGECTDSIDNNDFEISLMNI